MPWYDYSQVVRVYAGATNFSMVGYSFLIQNNTFVGFLTIVHCSCLSIMVLYITKWPKPPASEWCCLLADNSVYNTFPKTLPLIIFLYPSILKL